MPNIEIKHLFKLNRFPDSDFKLMCLMLYLPVGLVLLVLRSVLALTVLLIGCSLWDTPVVHRLINKIACLSLGITVTVQNPDKKENVDVFVSNNLSHFDHLVVSAVTGAVSPGSKMHPVLSRGLGVHYFGSQSNVESFKKNVALLLTEQKTPVYFTPEDKATNGKAILKFNRNPFTIANKVQPICISIERPLLDISLSTLGSTYWADIFCFMFSPLTNYKLRFLPALEKKNLSDVSDEEFAEVVRQNIAAALKIETPEFTAADVAEWEKRHLAEQRQHQRTQSVQPVQRMAAVAVDPEVRRMAMQVKEVLPHVPLNAIYKDLNKTRNVDTTITNILEGRVYFVPESVGTPTTAVLNQDQPSTSSSSINTSSSSSMKITASASSSTNDRDLFNTAASTFARSAHERTKSFQERKDQLIANARKRYIQKHNLDIPF